MNNDVFNKWRNNLLTLDRYENSSDAKEFLRLAKSASQELNTQVIDTLLGTFTNADDYGVQESILLILDKADPELYAERLASNFLKILQSASENEWPLLLIGRIVNSGSENKIKCVITAAKNAAIPRVMYDFICSDYFLDEYPEIKPYL